MKINDTFSVTNESLVPSHSPARVLGGDLCEYDLQTPRQFPQPLVTLPETATLYPIAEVARRLGVSPRTVWRLIAGGEFAQPMKLRGCNRWAETDIAAYLERLTSKRDRRQLQGDAGDRLRD